MCYRASSLRTVRTEGCLLFEVIREMAYVILVRILEHERICTFFFVTMYTVMTSNRALDVWNLVYIRR